MSKDQDGVLDAAVSGYVATSIDEAADEALPLQYGKLAQIINQVIKKVENQTSGVTTESIPFASDAVMMESYENILESANEAIANAGNFKKLDKTPANTQEVTDSLGKYLKIKADKFNQEDQLVEQIKATTEIARPGEITRLAEISAQEKRGELVEQARRDFENAVPADKRMNIEDASDTEREIAKEKAIENASKIGELADVKQLQFKNDEIHRYKSAVLIKTNPELATDNIMVPKNWTGKKEK